MTHFWFASSILFLAFISWAEDSPVPMVFKARSPLEAVVQARMTPEIRDIYRGLKFWPAEGRATWRAEIKTTGKSVWLDCALDEKTSYYSCVKVSAP